MMKPSPTRKAIPSTEQGYILLAAMFLLALLVLSLAIAMPAVVKSIQRDHDLETYHRGMQYRRAVQLYYRKFHAYPPNVDALVNSNSIRFLRKKYKDPITGQDDWKPVMFGQNKVPTAMGFFGQPLAGNASTVAGIGPSGGVGLPGITPLGGSPTSAFGSPLTGGNSIFGPSDNSNLSSNSTGTSSGSTGSTDNSGGTGSSTGSTGGTGTASGASSTSGTSSSSSSSGPSGQTFGGAGIIGFSPGSSKQSILVYKKKNHYNEWEFTYDPISDMQTMTGGNTGGIGQPATNTTNPIGSNPFGSSTPGNSGTTTPNPGSSSSPSSSSPTGP